MQLRSKALPPIAMMLIALAIGLRQFLQHSRPATDVPDFALGVLLGIGLGLLILFIWRNRPTADAR